MDELETQNKHFNADMPHNVLLNKQPFSGKDVCNDII